MIGRPCSPITKEVINQSRTLRISLETPSWHHRRLKRGFQDFALHGRTDVNGFAAIWLRVYLQQRERFPSASLTHSLQGSHPWLVSTRLFSQRSRMRFLARH